MAKKTRSSPRQRRTARKTAPRRSRSASIAPRPRAQPHDEPAPSEVSDDDAPEPSTQTIVGIGASAGGLEAVTKVLQNLTPDSGLAYVLVQHLAPKHDSFLAEVLRPTSRIPIVQAGEQMAIEPNRLHVIPPNVHMTITDGHLHLAPRPTDRTQYNPIDMFFQSLAAHAQHRAVGVILSGSASDGAVGMREIKGAGGFTMVQDPKTARYDGMPRASIATGAVDLVLTPEGIADELVRLGSHPFLAARPDARTFELSVTELQLERLFYLLRAASGVDFSHYKRPTIKRRLQRRMALHKITEVDQYLKTLDRDAIELQNLYRDILIHVTRFFREPESFVALRKTVFPKLIDDTGAKRPVRIWVPGCATGEEAYSIAIALLEYLGEDAPSVPLQVFATDISEEAIGRARAGIYPESISGDVSSERLRRFFVRVDGQYRITKLVRDSCIFARQDLTRDPPFSKLDLIVCRNVLIYLGPRLQRKLMGVFHYALKSSGFLMLGGTESAGASGEMFIIQDKRHKIYTKRNGLARAEIDLLSVTERSFDRSGHQRRAPTPVRPAASDLQSEVNRVLLSRYSPPGVVVDGELQIVQTRGRTGPYLELSSGEVSLNVLKMAREGVLHGLRSALKEAKKTNKPTRREGLLVRTNGSAREVDVQVFPFADSGSSSFYLVLFEELRQRQEPATPTSPRREDKKRKDEKREDPKITRLQQELTASREYLQSIIQDLEAANEELQSANEEILSSNEELQSTNEELDTAKEELQSTNEELNTVNEELNARNAELSLVNADLINLLAAVPAAIVIVTSELRIRRFTPLAEQVLNLIPTDVGRPLNDIRTNIEGADLEELARDVIDNVSARELAVRDRAGRHYTLRIRPYKDQENRIAGAVLAFTDGAPVH